MFPFHFWNRSSEYLIRIEIKAPFKNLDFEVIPQINQLSLQFTSDTIPMHPCILMHHSFADSPKHRSLSWPQNAPYSCYYHTWWPFSLFIFYILEWSICGLSKQLSGARMCSSVHRELPKVDQHGSVAFLSLTFHSRSSPSWFPFLIQVQMGYKWEAPGWIKRGSRRIRTVWKAAKALLRIKKQPGLLRREISTSDSLKYKDAFVNTIALPLFWLLPLGQQLVPKVLAAFWERYLIPFACNNHHFRSPATKGPNKQK